jgi:hypothetical protein
MSYVWAGYLASAAALGGYAVAMLRRGRELSRRLPPEERRWT